MQVDRVENVFVPYTLSLVVETLAEEDALYNRLQIPSHNVAVLAAEKPHAYRKYDQKVDMEVSFRLIKSITSS